MPRDTQYGLRRRQRITGARIDKCERDVPVDHGQECAAITGPNGDERATKLPAAAHNCSTIWSVWERAWAGFDSEWIHWGRYV